MTDEFVRSIAAAVINRACRDFAWGNCREEIEQFFCSSRYEFLSDCANWSKDGKQMMYELTYRHRVKERARCLFYVKSANGILRRGKHD